MEWKSREIFSVGENVKEKLIFRQQKFVSRSKQNSKNFWSPSLRGRNVHGRNFLQPLSLGWIKDFLSIGLLYLKSSLTSNSATSRDLRLRESHDSTAQLTPQPKIVALFTECLKQDTIKPAVY